MDDLNYSPPGTTPRLRGAQPGNTNALLHGLHSNRFRTAANRALHNANYTAGFDIEIMELRYIIANLEEYIQETSDVHTSLRLATAVISAVSTLSRLLRVQLLLASSNDAPLSTPAQPAQPPVLASPAQPAQTASRPLTPGGKGTSGLGTIRFHSFFSQNQSTPAKIAPSSLLFPSHSPP